MESSIELEKFISSLKEQANIQKLYRYFKEKKYLPIFIKQLQGLLTNLRSIEILTTNSNYEDAFTILRKYMETYFIIFSIIEHPELVSKYLVHDSFIGKKACGVDLKGVRQFREGKPDGYLEYGYLESVIKGREDFKYTARDVADAGNVSDFHKIYKTCNNFVHNNLTSVNVEMGNAKAYLETAISKTSKYLIAKVSKLIQ